MRLFLLFGMAWPCAAYRATAQEVPDPSGLFLDQHWSPPPTQQCDVLRRKPLPPLGTVFDTTALHREVARLGPGSVVLSVNDVSIRDSSIGAIPGPAQEWSATGPAVVVESTWPDSIWAALALRIASTLRPGAHGSFLLRIDVAGTVSHRTAPSLGCRPVLVDHAGVRRALRNLAARGYRGRAVLGIVVDTDGAPAQIVVERSSGNERVDHLFTVLAQTLTFEPALLNRVPVKAMFTLPLANR